MSNIALAIPQLTVYKKKTFLSTMMEKTFQQNVRDAGFSFFP